MCLLLQSVITAVFSNNTHRNPCLIPDCLGIGQGFWSKNSPKKYIICDDEDKCREMTCPPGTLFSVDVSPAQCVPKPASPVGHRLSTSGHPRSRLHLNFLTDNICYCKLWFMLNQPCHGIYFNAILLFNAFCYAIIKKKSCFQAWVHDYCVCKVCISANSFKCVYNSDNVICTYS